MMNASRWIPHPFDRSCVEKDMVARVFGWASDMHHDPALEIWKDLLARVGISTSKEIWEDVKVKFFAYPKHFGGKKRGGEIGDIVLLGPHLFIVVEAKRPGNRMDDKIEKKIADAHDLSHENGWPDPVFVALGTQDAQHPECQLLEWSTVSKILRNRLGPHNAISQFIDDQIALQSHASHSFGRFGQGLSSIAGLEWHSVQTLAELIIERAARPSPSPALEPKAKERYVNLSYSRRAYAQLHPHNQGVVLVVREADASCPSCEILAGIDIKILFGYWGANKRWLDGDGTAFTSRPAAAFLVPSALQDDPDHPGWQEVDLLLNYTKGR